MALRLQWEDSGEDAKLLVKSDFLPKPIPAPESFLPMRKPQYVLIGQLNSFTVYLGLGAQKRGDRANENVCFENERFVGDWLRVWKGTIDSKQNFSLIKIIISVLIHIKHNDHNIYDSFEV